MKRVEQPSPSSRSNEKLILALPAPGRGQVGWLWLLLILAIVAGCLLLAVGLKFIFSRSSSGLTLSALLVAAGGAIAFIISFAKNVSEQSRRSTKPAADTIKIYKDKIYLPSYLHYDKNAGEWLQIKGISDFEQLRLGKSPQLLAFTMKGESQKRLYYDTLEKADVEALCKALHSLSGLSEQYSPFGKRAGEIRKRKSSAWITGIVLTLLFCGGLILLSIFYPFTRLYSGMVSLGLYSLILAVPLARYLARGPLELLFRQKNGTPLPFWGLLVLLQCTLMFALYCINLLLAGGMQSENVVVEDKTRVRNKSSYSYHLKFALVGDSSFYPVSFGELSSARTGSRLYRRVQPGETLVRITYVKGPVGFSVIHTMEVLGPFSGAKKTDELEEYSGKMKNNDLATWTADLPEFGVPDRVDRQYWSPGKMRAEEPYVRGRKHGLARYTHPNGTRYASIYWVNGRKEGRYQTYRESGTLEADYSFHEGKAHGLNIWYDDQGRVTHRVVYKNGEVVQ